MALAAAAAVFYVLSAAFLIVAYATLDPYSSSPASGFAHAGSWLQFVAWIVALCSVTAACWRSTLRGDWQGMTELALAAVGTLLIAIGFLIGAVNISAGLTPYVLLAVGTGIWTLLAFGLAAVRSLVEEQADAPGRARPRYAGLWLVVAGGLLLFAIGSGFTLDPTDRATGIAKGVLQASGAAGVGAAIAIARSKGYLTSRSARDAMTGIGLLAAANVAVAVVAGLVFGSGLTLNGIRIGMSIATAILLVAGATLGVAAWARVREIVAERGTVPFT